jgi:hypothetical protein
MVVLKNCRALLGKCCERFSDECLKHALEADTSPDYVQRGSHSAKSIDFYSRFLSSCDEMMHLAL